MLRYLLATLVLLTAGMAPRPAAAQGLPVDFAAGRLRFYLGKNHRASLSVDGVPMIHSNTLYIVQENWVAPTRLNMDTDVPVVTTSQEGNVQVATAAFDTDKARAVFRYELHPDNVYRVRLTYSTKNNESWIQYWAGLLNANILAGAPYRAETVDGPRQGTVPYFATSSDQMASRLTPNLRNISFGTRLGRIDISVEGSDAPNQSVTLFDARLGTQDWAQRNPVFWMGVGVPDPKVTPGEHTVTITYRFGSLTTPNVTIPTAEGAAKTVAVSNAVTPYSADLPVIPRPKEQSTPSGPAMRVTSRTQIVIPDRASDEEIQAARELHATLGTYFGVNTHIKRAADSSASLPGSNRIVLTRPGLISAWYGQTEDIGKPEGYILKAQGNLALVGGADARGVYYGAQTLKQLFRADKDGVYIKPAAIRDWPSLGFRGVHWFGGPKSWPFHERMISRIVSPLKMNTMVYQADYTQWESQPKIWSAERSTPKADVRKTVDYARKHFLEPIPMVNGIGHAEWLFWNGQNLDLASDPNQPYAYNPENPRSYEALFPIMQEALDLFQPKTFHLGNDEVTMTGRFPAEGVNKSVTELIIEDTNRRHDWLKQRGVKTMMWGDMLLHHSEVTDAGHAPTVADAKQRREALPKDIIIADWHYQGTSPLFPSVKILQDLGYPVVGTTWYDWGNIQNFSRVLNREKSMGFLQSTWAGYAMSLDVLNGSEFKQFVAYLLGAEYAWNGGAPDVHDLGYSPDDAFLAMWDRKPVSMEKREGFTVDLSGVSNTGMWDWMPEPAPGKAPEKTFPLGRVSLGGVTFDVGHPVWLAGALNPAGAWPKSVTIPLDGRKASELYFLWGASHTHTTESRVASVRVNYEDGTTATMPVNYGGEIHAFTDQRSSGASFIAWQGLAPDGQPVSVRRAAWENPSPGKPIRSVTLESSGTQAAPILLGLTGAAR